MNHSFNVEIACEHSVNEAIVLENLFFWIRKNYANRTHYHEGTYWTYNTVKSFSDLFPYWSIKQVRNIFEKLEDKCLIQSGNFNKAGYDRTKWYSLTEKGLKLFGYLILPNGQMELPEKANGIAQNGKTIPDINTDINADVEDKSSLPSDDGVKPKTQKEISELIVNEWNKVAPIAIKKIVADSTREKMLKARIKQFSLDEVLEAISLISKSKFLTGQKGFVINFDWFIRPNNFIKVLENQYEDRAEVQNATNQPFNSTRKLTPGERFEQSRKLPPDPNGWYAKRLAKRGNTGEGS